MGIKKLSAKALKLPVIIHHNNEAGIWQWSVAVATTAFWLDSFISKHDAITFAEAHGLSYSIVDDKRVKSQ